MKRHRMRAALVVMLISWTLAGCGDPTGPKDDVVLTAQVNGLAWHAGGPGAPPTHATFYEGDSTVGVGGLRSGGGGHSDQIGLFIRRVTGPGTYPLGDPATGSAFYVVSEGTIADGTWTMTWYSTSAARRGTVVITVFEPSTNTLQGTFTFEAETGGGAWVTVTGGSFTGHYQTSKGRGF